MEQETSVSWTFKSEGNKLTGQVDQGGGFVMSLSNGKIDGDRFSFGLEVDIGDGPMNLKYTGAVVSPTELKLTVDAGGMSFEYSVKKQEAKK